MFPFATLPPMQITPAYSVLRSRIRDYNPTDRLWAAADDVLEYRQRHTGVEHLIQTEALLQQAACASEQDDRPRILSMLWAAAAAADDLDVRQDVYRLIYGLGFGCPAHGVMTFVFGEHVCCSVCGEALPRWAEDDSMVIHANSVIDF
jgi:hypothetical protein